MTRTNRTLALGGVRSLDGSGETHAYELPSDDLVTHGVVVGGTGSGKTGLLMVLVEEALRAKIPTILVDVKGDLPNLLLTFPELSGAEFEPWVDAQSTAGRGGNVAAVAQNSRSIGGRNWQTGTWVPKTWQRCALPLPRVCLRRAVEAVSRSTCSRHSSRYHPCGNPISSSRAKA